MFGVTRGLALRRASLDIARDGSRMVSYAEPQGRSGMGLTARAFRRGHERYPTSLKLNCKLRKAAEHRKAAERQDPKHFYVQCQMSIRRMGGEKLHLIFI
jgi:hypothetical protein